jgi:hypothetical protein
MVKGTVAPFIPTTVKASMEYEISRLKSKATADLDEKLTQGRSPFPVEGRTTTPMGEEGSTQRTVATPLGGGGWKKGIYQQYQIQPPTDWGDSTVLLRSSQTPEHYLQSRVGLPVEHEPAYKNSQAQRYTLWAIVKIAQKIKQTSLRYSDD